MPLADKVIAILARMLLAILSVALVLTAVVVEERVFARGREPRPRESLVWAAGWLSLAAAVGAGLFAVSDRGSAYATVYTLELSDTATVAVIGALFLVGASLVADRLDPPSSRERGQRRPPRCPPAAEVS